MKKLIVMLSTYNGEKYLDKQISSIFNQKTETEIEIKLVVRDDGSKDRTKEILKSWSQNHNLEIVEDHLSLGAAKSFWKLLNSVEDADYYAFVDQDDIWDSDKIECATSEMGESNTPILWFSNCRLIDSNDNVVKNRLKEKHQIPRLTVQSELVCGSAQGCAMVFNKATVDMIRKYSIKAIPMHDIVLMIYTIVLGKVLYHEQPLFSYRVHDNNVVAKQGKSFGAKIRSSYRQWFVVNKHAYKRLCAELIENLDAQLNKQTKDYLHNVVASERSICSRIAVIKNPETYHYSKSILRSYKIRVLLGII